MKITATEYAEQLAQIIENVDDLRQLYEKGKRRVLKLLAGSFAGELEHVIEAAAVLAIVAVLVDKLFGHLGNNFATRAKRDYLRSATAAQRFAAQFQMAWQVPVAHSMQQAAALAEMRRLTMASVGGQIRREVQQRLVIAEALRVHNEKLVPVLDNALSSQWWRIERAAKTEASFAVNLAQTDMIVLASREHRRVMKRWTEMVDDSGKPLDNRVAPDSLAMHGQLAPPDGVFVMPSDERAPPKMIGKTWSHPPNRPNDRAVVLPWMKEWGIPGWRWNGRRVPA